MIRAVLSFCIKTYIYLLSSKHNLSLCVNFYSLERTSKCSKHVKQFTHNFSPRCSMHIGMTLIQLLKTVYLEEPCSKLIGSKYRSSSAKIQQFININLQQRYPVTVKVAQNFPTIDFKKNKFFYQIIVVSLGVV